MCKIILYEEFKLTSGRIRTNNRTIIASEIESMFINTENFSWDKRFIYHYKLIYIKSVFAWNWYYFKKK